MGRRFSLLLLAAAFTIVLALAGAAQAATLSGTVTRQSGAETPVALPGATIYAYDQGTGAFANRVQTDVLGGYSMLLPSGTYVIEVVSGGSQQLTFRSVDVTRAAQLDATLVPTGYARLHGTLREHDGTPIADASVGLSRPRPRTGIGTETAADGSFSLAVTQDVYSFSFVDQIVDQWSFQGQIDLSSDRELELTLPERAAVTVRVLDDADAGVPAMYVQLLANGRPQTIDGVAGQLNYQAWGTTDAAGELVVHPFDGPQSPTARLWINSAPSPYSYTEVPLPDLRGATTLDVHLAHAAQLLLSLRDGDGDPINGASAFIDGRWGQWNGSDPYWLDGTAGGRTLTVSGYDAISWWRFASGVFDFDGRQEETLTLPFSQRHVRVVDGSGAPVDGATVTAPVQAGAAGAGRLAGTLELNGYALTTDRSGEVTVRSFAGATSDPQSPGTVTPPAGSGLPAGSFTLADRGVTTVMLGDPPREVHVSGSLVYEDGSPIEHVGAFWIDQEWVTYGADGSFELDVVPGQHSLDVRNDWFNVRGDFTVAGAGPLVIRLPRVALTIRVRSGAAPLPGATVRLSLTEMSGRFGLLDDAFVRQFDTSVVTGADGLASFARFVGTPASSAFFTPPSGTPYEPNEFALPQLDDDLTTDYQLPAIDDEAPQISCDPAPTGWQTQNVAIACGATDAGSGLADPRADAAFTLSTGVPAGSEDPRAFTGTREVCDVAGNCATAGPIGPIAVDRAAPAITLDVSPEPLVRGDWWSVSRVAVTVTASDGNGVAALACSVDGVTRTFTQTRTATTRGGVFYVNAEGRHTAACTALDGLAHSGSQERAINLDLKNPAAPTASADRAADNLVYGWWRDSVTVSFADNGDPLLADGSAGSGVDPASVTAPLTYDRSGTYTAAGTVADRSGRVSAAGRVTVKVDADAPTSTLTCPANPVTLGGTGSARWQDADGQSGLAGGATGSVALDASAIGSFAATHAAVDRVGHTTTSTCRYRVVYAFAWRGNLQAAPALNAIAPGVSTQTVWFSIGGDQGRDPIVAGSPQVEPVDCTSGAPSGRATTAALAGSLVWDAVNGRYGIPWNVAADLPSGSCAALRLQLVDGVEREVRFAR